MQRIFEERGIRAEDTLLEVTRVLFSDSPRIPDPHRAEAFAQRAREAEKREIPFFPATRYMEYERTGSRDAESIQNTRRIMLMQLLTNAAAGGEDHTDKIIDLVWALLEESNWSCPAHNNMNVGDKGEDKPSPLPLAYEGGSPHHIDLMAQATGAMLAVALYLCEEQFDRVAPVISRRIRHTLDDRILEPFLTQDFWWMGLHGEHINNWNPWCISGVLTVCAVVETSLERRRQIVARALPLLDNYTASLPADGGCDEGPAYFGKAGAAYFDCLELLWDLSGGRIDVFSHPFVAAIGNYIVNTHISGSYFVNFADAPLRTLQNGDLLVRFGTRIGSEALTEFGRHMQGLSSYGVMDHMAPYRSLRGLYQDKAPEGTGGRPLTDTFLPVLGVMTRRQLPAYDKGLFLAAKAGHNRESHNHNDVGNFVVYRDGEPMIIDTGVDTYTKTTFNHLRYTLWYMNSDYHNLPVILGQRQKPGAEYRGEILSYEEGKGMTVDLSHAWPQEARIRRYERDFFLLGDTVTVHDRLSLLKAGEVCFCFMVAARPEVADGVLRLAGGGEMTYDPSLALTVDQVPLGPEGTRMREGWKTPHLYRLRFAPKEAAETYDFVWTFVR